MTSALDPERLFGQLAIEKGLARPEHVQECLDLIQEMDRNRVSPLPRLADLLQQKGYLNLSTFEKTVRIEDHKTEPSYPSSPAQELPPGEPFGKYIRNEKLGEGGMGEVWKAWDTELRRWVAIKFLKTNDKVEKERFRREAQTAASLIHPNIMSIYEAGDSHIVMQYIDGRNLLSTPPTDQRQIASIVREVALALQFAHDKGIIHRDIKSANIMTDSSSRVYVMDFGLAKSAGVDASVSLSGSIVGTPAYMSPEQAQGQKLDHRTDVYSLGATLYELLTGRPPHHGGSPYEVLKKVVEEEPWKIELHNPRADRDLRTIAMKCLEKDPSRRYATARELADDLGRFLGGDAILARPLSNSEKMRRYVKRHRSIFLTAGIVGVLALLVGGSFFVWTQVREAGLIRKGLAEAERLEAEALGDRAERREKLMKARATLNQTLELNRHDRRVIDALARVDGKIQAILKEEDDEVAKMKSREDRLRRIGIVMKRWEHLGPALDQLETISSDHRLAADARLRAAAEPWKAVQAFKDETPPDSASQSIMLALAGRARWTLYRGADPDGWMTKASEVDPSVPYGCFVSAFSQFVGDLDDPTLPDGPSEPLAKQILDWLDCAMAAPDWLELTRDEYEAVMNAIRHMLTGDYAAAEKSCSYAIVEPELVWLVRDLYMIRARARFLQKNYAGAIDDQEQVAKMRKFNVAARFWLGRFKLAQATASSSATLLGEAFNDLKDTIALDPRCAAAHARLGDVLMAQQKFKDAVVAYETALTILPDSADLQRLLQAAREKAGS